MVVRASDRLDRTLRSGLLGGGDEVLGYVGETHPGMAGGVDLEQLGSVLFAQLVPGTLGAI